MDSWNRGSLSSSGFFPPLMPGMYFPQVVSRQPSPFCHLVFSLDAQIGFLTLFSPHAYHTLYHILLLYFLHRIVPIWKHFIPSLQGLTKRNSCGVLYHFCTFPLECSRKPKACQLFPATISVQVGDLIPHCLNMKWWYLLLLLYSYSCFKASPHHQLTPWSVFWSFPSLHHGWLLIQTET